MKLFSCSSSLFSLPEKFFHGNSPPLSHMIASLSVSRTASAQIDILLSIDVEKVKSDCNIAARTSGHSWPSLNPRFS
jgi:hypothetical protein